MPFVRRWWWFLLLAVGVPMVLTPIRLAAPDYYVASSVLYVSVAPSEGGTLGTPSTASAPTVARLARSTSVLAEVITPEITTTPVRTLSRTIEVRAVAGEALVDLRVPGSTAEEAARTVRAVEGAVVAAAAEYGLVVEVLQPGESAVQVVRHPVLRDVIIGAWAGLLLAAGSILVVALGFRTRRPQAATIRPVAGVVPVLRHRSNLADLADWVSSAPDAAIEAYRVVRLVLLRHVTPEPGRPLLVAVTGTAPPGSIAQVTYGVSSVLARAGWHVLLVDERLSAEGGALLGVGAPRSPRGEAVHPHLDRIALTSDAGLDRIPASLDELRDRVGAAGEYEFVVLNLPGALRATTAAVVGRVDVVLFVAAYEDDLGVAELPPYGPHPRVLTIYAQPTGR